MRFRSLPQYGLERVERDARVIRGVSAAQAGEALGHSMILDQRTLAQIVEMGNAKGVGVKARFTHPGLSSDGLAKFLGRARDFRVEGDKALCDLHVSDVASRSPDGNLGDYVLDRAEEDPASFGMSIVFSGHTVWAKADGEEVPSSEGRPVDATTKYPVMRLDKLHAVDAVDEPAANRDGLFSEDLWASNSTAEEAFTELDAVLAQYGVSPAKAHEVAMRYFAARHVFEEERAMGIDSVFMDGSPAATLMSGSGSSSGSLVFYADDDVSASRDEGWREELASVRAEMRAAKLEAKLARSGLRASSQNVVRAGLTDREFGDVEVDGLIEAQRKVEAEFAEATVVRGMPNRVSGMQADLDKVKEAVLAMFEQRKPKDEIRPLQGVRELYTLLSGDYEMTGLFHPERVELANVTTVTMPNLVINAMNKRVVSIFQTYDHWWKPIVQEEDAPNLQNMRHLKLGGMGEMPEVAEGAAYQETSWADDYETSGWTKKGHYIGLTMEAIDKDDTNKLVLAPRALAQSAYLTIGKDMARLFTQNSGVGPLLADAKAWFHTDHANLGTSAFSISSWQATIMAMRKQTELGSGERLGNLTAPQYILYPMDMEFTVLELLASALEPTTANNRANVMSNGDTQAARMAAARAKMIMVPFWTDATDWAAIADPNQWTVLKIGYRWGREPEVFSAQDPNSGLMFTNDTMAIKVRWVYSLGVVDSRGVYKQNVAG